MHNKYDTKISLDKNSSLTYIINNIAPNSTVLEFGPATGYMTRYLNEELNCRVYIVEIDRDSFQNAMNYAEDGLCSDAEQLEWEEYYKDIKFDYITFADVLEHLINPQSVLKKAKSFLKDKDSKILISIPNIAHNAVLIDLYNDKFQYRNTGIMDNTHMRFFTYDSIYNMIKESELFIWDEDAVVFGLDYVGFGNSEKDVPKNMWNELRNRSSGYVNQYLFTLSTEINLTYTKKEYGLTYPNVLYYSLDEKFVQQDKIEGVTEVKNGCFETIFDLPKGYKNFIVSLVPFNGRVNNLCIEADSNVLKINKINGFTQNDKDYFYGDDIRYEICFSELTTRVSIYGQLAPLQVDDMIQYFKKCDIEAKRTIRNKDLEVKRLNDLLVEKDKLFGKTIDEIHREYEYLNATIDEKNELLQEYQNKIVELNKQLIKDEEIYKQNIAVINHENERLNLFLEDKHNVISELQVEIRRLNEQLIKNENEYKKIINDILNEEK